MQQAAANSQDSPMPDCGTITRSGPQEVIAGNRVTLTFTYTAGRHGMKRGGSLRIRTPNDGWEAPQAHKKQLPKGIENRRFSIEDATYCTHNRCNVSASLQTKSRARVELRSDRTAGPLCQYMVAVVCGDDLAEGDVITLVYGDRTWGEDGVTVQKVAPTPDDRFVAHVDVNGSGDFVPLDDASLKLTVRPGPLSQYNLVARAIVRPEEFFELRVAGMDAFRNRPDTSWEGELRLGCGRPDISLPGTITFRESDHNRASVHDIKARNEGVYRLSVEPAQGGKQSVSNPVWCTRRNLHVFFGDLHCHSWYHAQGRSIGTPDENYAFGRDVAGLDFMAITDTGGYKTDGWVETQEATNRYYEPGRFATFKGFEHGYSRGHRNVIYRDCVVEPTLDLSEGFFEYFQGRQDVLMIPHHTKVRTDWDYFDAELEPIVEVYSCWGSGVEHADPLWSKSEKPGSGVFNALRRGYRLGFIGSGDSHAGMPGRSFPQDRMWFMHQRSGLACVYAAALTREAIFDALRLRHCYATTGVRAILEFSVNDTVMGSEVDIIDAGRPRVIRVHAIGTEPLSSLRIIKNNEELVRKALYRDEEFFEYYDTSEARQDDHYYVRIVQRDGNTLWSSPVWIKMQDAAATLET